MESSNERTKRDRIEALTQISRPALGLSAFQSSELAVQRTWTASRLVVPVYHLTVRTHMKFPFAALRVQPLAQARPSPCGPPHCSLTKPAKVTTAAESLPGKWCCGDLINAEATDRGAARLLGSLRDTEVQQHVNAPCRRQGVSTCRWCMLDSLAVNQTGFY